MLKLHKYCCFILVGLCSTALFSEESKDKSLGHKAGQFIMGINAAVGYNLINHVDGTLAMIPNNAEPGVSPGSPVYSHPISMSIDAPFLSTEYWFSSSWSIKAETGLNMFVVGAKHALADFAYLLTYWKVNFGSRYYFADAGVDYLFLGLGWFANFPVGAPWIGFIQTEGKGRIDTGPYAEIGINYPVTEKISLELFGRFYFGIRALTKKDDPGILTEIALSPFDIGFGINWTIL